MSELVTASEQAIAKGSTSFAAAARLLPRAVRDDTVMLYAWCRHADDVVDGQVSGAAPAEGHDAAAAVAALRAETLGALHGDGPMAPPFAALGTVARRHDFPDAWPLALIDGFTMDAEGRRYATLTDTLDYAYHVAGVVGVMMARVMGVRDEDVLDRACDLGLAFQMTNIARDVQDDAAIGRVYLPQDWLDAAGARVDAPGTPALNGVIARLVSEAEPYYASARGGLAGLPLQAAWSIAAALRVYRAIGRKILRAGPGFDGLRVSTSGVEKAALIAAAAADAAASRWRPPPPRPAKLWTRPRTP
ncbi:phytoene/squalene synthase family protein [Paracoccus aurantiacus]|uniref:Phytoene/squalene synthase family protein n=1 Tax=Paracoccus aurantiacus TaxID=2599412 RepID=A0A5C6RUG2_9RHOB|nr:phytoene/squalene synthase family protein [Paracoccus aurantiacus]TXB65002.1 phytoene/squalene synthase family protein [Paracoccus aurantiacus]